VITSRSDLRGLVALNDAKVVKLGVLPLTDAVRLLEKVIGTDRAEAEPAATAELARLCACLPLALRIAASLLVSEPHLRIQDLADQLNTGDRLAELEFGDDQEAAVRAAFDLSYSALGPEERRMFRMLGLAPRADFTPMSAGALLGVPSTQALKLLRGLARAHLVEERAPHRFSQHDLLRLHARECAAAEESGDQRRAAIVRLLDHFLHSVNNATRTIRVNRPSSPLTNRDPVVETVEFADGNTALAWCGQEHDLLMELCEFALAHQHLEHAWMLPSRMWTSYLKVHGSTEDCIQVFSIALEAARRLPDRYAEAVALHNLGMTYKRMHRLEEALDLLHQALRIRYERNDHFGIAVNESELGAVYLLRGDQEKALHHDRRSAEHYRSAGDDIGLATSLNNLACDLLAIGDFTEAAKVADNAAEVYASRGAAPDPPLEDTRAKAKFGMGDLGGAVRIYRSLFSGSSLDHVSNYTRVEILLSGAEVLTVAGHRLEALQCARKALIATTLGKMAGADKIRQLVEELEAATGVP
jgi:tetratricopeptide (TPR) repeat protein